MHLWPERVVPKCAEDRSLATAHDLEDVFWLEDANGKWQPREAEAATVDELVEERTSTAVTEALESLLTAPVPIDYPPAQAQGSPVASTRHAAA